MKNTSPFVIYLLHYPQDVRGKRHYMGITRTDRLARRMREHATGGGGATSRRLGRLNSKFHLVALWPVLSRCEEQPRKRKGHYKRNCPICCSGSESVALSTHTIELFDLQAEAAFLGGCLSLDQ